MAFTKVLPAGISSATNLVIDSINSAGIVTATGIVASTGTFSGNVSIAGTLTYEDVTNIDSVGIITAQSGIHVTGGSVGIGTDNPNAPLHIEKDGTSQVLARFESNMGTNNNRSISIKSPTSDSSSEPFLFQTGNSYQFQTDDQVGLHINFDRKIGIGTDNPQQPIHLLASNPAIRLQDTGSNTSYAQVSGNGGKLYLQADDNNVQGSSAIEFHLDGDVKALINSSGNIGIGSDNPSRRLHVQSPGSTPSALFGNSENNNSIEVTRTGSTGSYFQVQTYTNICNIVGGPTLTFRTSDPVGSASTERLRITPSGDVGLKLTNNSTVKYGLTLAQGSTDPYKLGWADGGGTKRGAIWVNSTNDAMEFMTGTSDAQRMRIRSDGRFELTTNGTYLTATSVDYYVNAGTSRTYGFYVHKNGTGTYGSYTYVLGGNSTQYAVGGQVDTNSAYSSGGGLFYSINSNTYGIVGYWSTSAYYTLYGNGVALATGGHTTSDARLKDVQSGIGTGILDKVCSLEAKKYTWKENSQQRRSVGGGTQIGLLAQDVQEHFPEVVMEHENPQIAGHNPETLNEQIGTTYSVEYGKLTAVLIEAIKELRSENNALAERITALEG